MFYGEEGVVRGSNHSQQVFFSGLYHWDGDDNRDGVVRDFGGGGCGSFRGFGGVERLREGVVGSLIKERREVGVWGRGRRS